MLFQRNCDSQLNQTMLWDFLQSIKNNSKPNMYLFGLELLLTEYLNTIQDSLISYS